MPVSPTTAYSSTRVVTGLVRSLLNDTTQNGYPVPIKALSRLNNIVTVATTTPNGLVSGDTALIAGVTGGSADFGGTFIVGYIDTFTFNYQQSGADSTANPNSGTSTPLYDAGGVGLGLVYTDPYLMPYCNSAYRKVQRALAMTGTQTFTEDNVFFVVPAVTAIDPTVQVVISDATAPPNQLPPDLIEPLKIWERQNDSNDIFYEMNDMTANGGLYPRNQVQNLLEWEWRSDELNFIGATQDVQIRLRYKAAFAPLSDGTSTILIRNAQEVMAYYVAAQASGARGSPMAETFAGEFSDSLEDMVAAATRMQQDRPRRRRPYSSKSGYGGWYL